MPISLDSVGKEFDPVIYEMSPQRAILYALGVGTPPSQLDYLYESNLRILPTFAVIPAFPVLGAAVAGLGVNPFMIVHGEQAFTIHKPFPHFGKLETCSRLEAIYDKGKGALVVIEAVTRDEKGQGILSNTFSLFVRGEGGFGGPRGPAAEPVAIPTRAPDSVVQMATRADQALIFRLSGDINPLHADPGVAQAVGYPKPILHGLCTHGFCGRAVLEQFCGMDETKFAGMTARFTGVVYPGETLEVEMWKDTPTCMLLQARTKERGEIVLSNAAVTLQG